MDTGVAPRGRSADKLTPIGRFRNTRSSTVWRVLEGADGGAWETAYIIWTRRTIREASGGPPRSAAPAGHRYPPTGPGNGPPGELGSEEIVGRAVTGRRGHTPSKRPGSSAGGPPLTSGVDGMRVRSGCWRRRVRPVPTPPAPRLPRPDGVGLRCNGRPPRRSTAAETERVDSPCGARHSRPSGRTEPYGLSPGSAPRDAAQRIEEPSSTWFRAGANRRTASDTRGPRASDGFQFPEQSAGRPFRHHS